MPGQHAHALVTPWAGTSHPVWFKGDPRVANCKALGGVFAREVMEGFVATQKMFEEQIKPLPPDQQKAALANIAASIQAGMPPRENPRVNISLDSVYASGPLGRAHCVIHGNSNYKQTGLLQALRRGLAASVGAEESRFRVGVPGLRAPRAARGAEKLRAHHEPDRHGPFLRRGTSGASLLVPLTPLELRPCG